MFENDRLSRSQILDDPLIRLVMNADGVSRADLSALMDEVSTRRKRYASRPASVARTR